MAGTLYIVATPIGNLEDITLRAIRVLAESDLVLCEDTRVTKKLLYHYDIKTKTMSYHANSSLKKEKDILQMLEEGKTLSLVSDAGTPAISDPGVLLVEHVHRDLPECKVIPVPGPSALVSALSASGLSTAEFHFFGFLPHKKGRETIFAKIREAKYVSVFYESTHRIEKTLESLAKVLNKGREVVIAREMTKLYEEFVKGDIDYVKRYFAENKSKIRGEFVVMVDAIHN